METISVKARHFKDAQFLHVNSCPIGLAIKEQLGKDLGVMPSTISDGKRGVVFGIKSDIPNNKMGGGVFDKKEFTEALGYAEKRNFDESEIFSLELGLSTFGFPLDLV